MVLVIPGTCLAEYVKLYQAVQRCRHLTSDIISRYREVPDWRMDTIAPLLQINKMRFVDQEESQMLLIFFICGTQL